ncbi:hypothetical protein Nepgr_003440 [Nepenthes gracilis]|uniref:HECT-type E3 ubiquitin transferase n=1 Tax=Nepenthes gracilis TaxID=150966 RepID=A0AAD3RZI1_NEPGR|nr:hypothetical protein Nepgr_003440 [Nepenthes gracilis]
MCANVGRATSKNCRLRANGAIVSSRSSAEASSLLLRWSKHDHHHSPLRISVRRAYILEDSYNQLQMRSTHELKVIFDKGALLFTTVGNDSTFQPNSNSVYQTEHLSYFKIVGRVVGKAVYDGQLLDVHFTRSFYKHILWAKVTYHDIEAIDPDYYKNLKWMLENDISDVLDLTFSIDADEEKLILYKRTEIMTFPSHSILSFARDEKILTFLLKNPVD